jgi:hypothetical protein
VAWLYFYTRVRNGKKSFPFIKSIESSGFLTHSLHSHLDLLKDETSEIDLVGPTFPALKALLNLPVAPGSDDKERYNRLIHALLSTCLRHIDGMR